ncbi:MAG TPA: hypothetical protein VLC91_10500 [Spongiibacteraceae bacterium]|nr:hypothetical protein [Spongiibacteraceae bacterium]
MKKRVVVWGTGNVGRPAIRAIVAHHDLELAGVIVNNPTKVGRDAGAIAGIADTGVLATNDGAALLQAGGIDAVVYAANADLRPQEAFAELLLCLRSGANVVSTAFYPLLYPATTPPELKEMIDEACAQGHSSVFVSGIDPGWALDMLPVILSGVVSDIREIRCQEIFNYALYDQPEVVRNVIGFGQSMDNLPMMLNDFALRMVWEPMVRLVGDGLGRPVEDIEIVVERRPLTRTIQVPGMGQFDEGTQGAFRFEVRGMCGGKALYVAEHITRIDDECAPDWPYPPEGRGCHRVIIKGNPDLHVTIHGEDAFEPGPAGGGNTTAANRLVNAIPAVCASQQNIVTPLDLPLITGGRQLRV